MKRKVFSFLVLSLLLVGGAVTVDAASVRSITKYKEEPTVVDTNSTYLYDRDTNRCYGEMYVGTRYYCEWDNDANEESVYAQMLHADSSVSNLGGDAWVRLSRVKSGGVLTILNTETGYITGEGDSIQAWNTSSSNPYETFDTHGEWTSLDGGYTSFYTVLS